MNEPVSMPDTGPPRGEGQHARYRRVLLNRGEALLDHVLLLRHALEVAEPGFIAKKRRCKVHASCTRFVRCTQNRAERLFRLDQSLERKRAQAEDIRWRRLPVSRRAREGFFHTRIGAFLHDWVFCRAEANQARVKARMFRSVPARRELCSNAAEVATLEVCLTTKSLWQAKMRDGAKAREDERELSRVLIEVCEDMLELTPNTLAIDASEEE
jgi:hypothetical protein